MLALPLRLTQSATRHALTRIQQRPHDPQLARRLQSEGLPPLLARLYAARGVQGAQDIQHRLGQLLPPEQLLGADTAARLLAEAIATGQKLLIVGDYDADGATASAVGVKGLRLLGAQVDYLVPHRMEHGYGLSPEVAALAAQRRPDLIITVDNGIAAHAGIAAAGDLGIPVLVTDHHLPGATLPPAVAIVNPNQPGCAFPSKHLAGVGVMFYLLLALRAELRRRGAYAGGGEPDLRVLLDLVALGTVADVVKLDANNRILVAQGLARMRAGLACAGIRALFAVAGRDPARAAASDLGFLLGPRLNAAGRLDDMALGVECLLAADLAAAEPLARRLDELNRARKDVEGDMLEAALARLEGYDPADRVSLALYQPDWHAGVVGLLASRLKEKYHRPVIAFAPGGDGELKGSGRSIPGLHLRDALDLLDRRQPGLMTRFGGHAMAAGLSLQPEHFPAFAAAWETVARDLLSPADLARVIETDGELPPGEITLEQVAQLESGVWGQGFPPPLFEATLTVLQQRLVGEKHMKLTVDHGGQRLDALAFFHAEPLPARMHAVFAPMSNHYNGSVTLQLRLQHWEALA